MLCGCGFYHYVCTLQEIAVDMPPEQSDDEDSLVEVLVPMPEPDTVSVDSSESQVRMCLPIV